MSRKSDDLDARAKAAFEAQSGVRPWEQQLEGTKEEWRKKVREQGDEAEHVIVPPANRRGR